MFLVSHRAHFAVLFFFMNKTSSDIKWSFITLFCFIIIQYKEDSKIITCDCHSKRTKMNFFVWYISAVQYNMTSLHIKCFIYYPEMVDAKVMFVNIGIPFMITIFHASQVTTTNKWAFLILSWRKPSHIFAKCHWRFHLPLSSILWQFHSRRQSKKINGFQAVENWRKLLQNDFQKQSLFYHLLKVIPDFLFNKYETILFSEVSGNKAENGRGCDFWWERYVS